MQKQDWYNKWFNHDYLNLYNNRNESEAQQHIKFLQEHLDIGQCQRILDLGCGTGRHARLLAALQKQVVGIDSSSYLINEAKKFAEKNPGLDLQFVKQDMRDITNIGSFELVISMFTSFGYFENDEENWQVFKNVNQTLVSRGKFFLDFLNPHWIIKNLVAHETKEVAGETVEIRRTIQDNIVFKTIQFPHRIYYEKVKLYSQEEIEKQLNLAGFNVIKTWGDYDGSPLHKESKRQMFYSESLKDL